MYPHFYFRHLEAKLIIEEGGEVKRCSLWRMLKKKMSEHLRKTIVLEKKEEISNTTEETNKEYTTLNLFTCLSIHRNKEIKIK